MILAVFKPTMFFGMFAARKGDQVLRTIVGKFSIDVMNLQRRSQGFIVMLLPNKPVFRYISLRVRTMVFRLKEHPISITQMLSTLPAIGSGPHLSFELVALDIRHSGFRSCISRFISRNNLPTSTSAWGVRVNTVGRLKFASVSLAMSRQVFRRVVFLAGVGRYLSVAAASANKHENHLQSTLVSVL